MSAVQSLCSRGSVYVEAGSFTVHLYRSVIVPRKASFHWLLASASVAWYLQEDIPLAVYSKYIATRAQKLSWEGGVWRRRGGGGEEAGVGVL